MTNNYTRKQIEILDISTQYLSKYGVQSFSLRNIAEEVGIKQPSLYGHFKNKEEIIKGIFNLYKHSVEIYNNSLISLKATKLIKSKIYFKKMCEFIQYKPNYMNLVMLEIYQYRNLFKKEDLNFLLNNMHSVIERAEEDSGFEKNIDYNYLILVIDGILHVYLKNKLTNNDFDVLKNADKFWEYFEELIKKEQEA